MPYIQRSNIISNATTHEDTVGTPLQVFIPYITPKAG